jgi:cytochrome oxidase Cu insertion factor (SCO1/SenC/PrrC family)
MPGMHSGLDVTNPVLVAAFRAALMHQGLIALLILATFAIVWASAREWRPSQAARAASSDRASRPEPAARRMLRLGFGLLWIFDGILQAQPAMAAGLASKVIAPAATTSPTWVQHLVNWAGTTWSLHPVQAGAAAVWIQVGIGIWLLAARSGPWSRLAGLASVGWGLVVWVFGEALGGVLAPGLSVLFGAPGAALLYSVAGALVALPGKYWQSAALGKRLLAALGLFFAGMAVLQAWPGRGFWQGTSHGARGALTRMIASMSSTPQPTAIAHVVSGFGSLAARHGFAVNAVAVAILGGIGVGLLSQRRQLLLPVALLAAVFSVADWVLIEDLGFLGGLGTDPNSMIPLLLLLGSGYVAVTQAAPAPEPVGLAAPSTGRAWRDQVRPARLAGGLASASAQGILAFWAVVLVLLGAAPMAMAQANPNADPIIAEALGGSSAPLDVPASPFQLTSENGRPVSLASLRGKVVLMTFLDPVCTTDCPLIAQEMRAADQMLGARAASVQLIAIAANPLYYSTAALQAFDRQEQLTGLRNWLFLTGTLSQLHKVWSDYGINAVVLPGGQMIAHNDLMFVIDRAGTVRYEINSDPGPGTVSTKSSFAVEFAQAAERALSSSRSPT